MKFKIIVVGIFSIFYLYLFQSLVMPLGSNLLKSIGGILLSLNMLAILWVPLVFWQSTDDKTSSRERVMLWIANCSLGYLSFVMVLSALRDLVQIWFEPPWTPEVLAGGVLSLALIFFLWGFWRGQFGVGLKTTLIPMNHVPEGLKGLRILQITDLHVGATIRRRFVEKVVRLAEKAKPDLIVLTGDVADGIPADLETEMEPLKNLSAPLGKYYVTGNHEYYWDGPQWIGHMKKIGFQPLLNTSQTIKKNGVDFLIGGIPDPTAASFKLEKPQIELALPENLKTLPLKIFLCHQPKFAKAAQAAGFDLQISGHTHGGQFFPWTLIANKVHRFNYGLKKLENMFVYVSRGTGYWGPPVRLGSPAEVSLLIIS